MNQEFDRRNFIKLIGHYAVGGLVAVVLPARGETPNASSPAPPAPDGYDWTKYEYVYLIDAGRCIGCGLCVRTCRQENKVPANFYRTWVERYLVSADFESFVDSPAGGEEGFGHVEPGLEVSKGLFVPKMCNHCEQTPCIQVCPVGASYRTLDGLVLVDGKRCIGCGYCVQACPYGSRFMNPETHTADKCTWCYHRITRGLLPGCVGACPTQARRFGNLKDKDDPVRRIIAAENVVVLQPELLTHPRCFYQGLDMEVR
jgi:Fe-S-cluster-containing dehydrogenase component